MPEAPKAAAKAAKPDHIGHRERLRERFMTGGSAALPDYEMLELLLYYAYPRIDVKPLAKRMEKEFGGFAGAIAAPEDRLLGMDGVNKRVPEVFRVVREAAIRLQHKQILKQPVLSDWQAVLDYCHSVMAHRREEEFHLLFLDAKNRLLEDCLLSRGTIDHTPVYIREIVKEALRAGAAAAIMVHNHPSGDPTPSGADIAMTREVETALEKLGIRLHDHLIIGRTGHASLRALGHLARNPA